MATQGYEFYLRVLKVSLSLMGSTDGAVDKSLPPISVTRAYLPYFPSHVG